MKHGRRMALAAGTAIATVSLLGTAGAAGAAASGPAGAAALGPAPAEVRVNQVGYTPGSSKVAFAMLPGRVSQVSFTVSGGHGVVFRGRSHLDAGQLELGVPRGVYVLDFTRLTRAGQYRITVSAGGATAVSPRFAVEPARLLYHQLVLNGVRYFTSERDGGDVAHSVLGRQAANLTDRHAVVYRDPRYDSNDNLLGTFHRAGGPVNVSGGWFDAGGGYEKFAFTASYTDGLLLLAARDFPGQYRTLLPEAAFGLRWLNKSGQAYRQDPLHPGGHRQRQREQHDPGRLQLLAPPAG